MPANLNQVTVLTKKRGERSGLKLAEQSGKLHLKLRTLRFESELQRMKLPQDTHDLLNYLVRLREETLRNKYDTVFAFTTLKSHGSFWTDFGYSSLDHMLSELDLHNGQTLGMWEVLVHLFDRDTFLLVGDDTLYYMTRTVGEYQTAVDKKKEDYQNIFDAYCAKYLVFDKVDFRATVNMYVNRRYVRRNSSIRVADVAKRPSQPTQAKGTVRIQSVKPVSGSPQMFGPELKYDFEVKHIRCSGCVQKEQQLKAALFHIHRLETLIKSVGAAAQLPARPKILDNI
jgi:hypothetical protein